MDDFNKYGGIVKESNNRLQCDMIFNIPYIMFLLVNIRRRFYAVIFILKIVNRLDCCVEMLISEQFEFQTWKTYTNETGTGEIFVSGKESKQEVEAKKLVLQRTSFSNSFSPIIITVLWKIIFSKIIKQEHRGTEKWIK